MERDSETKEKIDKLVVGRNVMKEMRVNDSVMIYGVGKNKRRKRIAPTTST